MVPSLFPTWNYSFKFQFTVIIRPDEWLHASRANNDCQNDGTKQIARRLLARSALFLSLSQHTHMHRSRNSQTEKHEFLSHAIDFERSSPSLFRSLAAPLNFCEQLSGYFVCTQIREFGAQLVCWHFLLGRSAVVGRLLFCFDFSSIALAGSLSHSHTRQLALSPACSLCCAHVQLVLCMPMWQPTQRRWLIGVSTHTNTHTHIEYLCVYKLASL